MNKFNFININKLYTKNNSKNQLNDNYLKYSLKFVSLFPLVKSTNFEKLINDSLKTTSQTFIRIKQSYLLLAWFYYIKFSNEDLNDAKFFTLPKTFSKFTTTKAPMAHKTWSKEQYGCRSYSFVLSFKIYLEKSSCSINEILFFIMSCKRNFPFYETNLFFIKSYKFLINIKNFNYFNYNMYILK